MNTFYFNTGVKISNYPLLCKGQVNRGGTKQIPFDVEAPENSTVLFLCDNPDLPEGKRQNIIVAEVHNSTIISKYAYMIKPINIKEDK